MTAATALNREIERYPGIVAGATAGDRAGVARDATFNKGADLLAVALLLLCQGVNGVEPDLDHNIRFGIELMARGLTDDEVTVIVGTVAMDDLRRTPEQRDGKPVVPGIDVNTALMSLGLTRVYVYETLYAKQPVPAIVYVQQASTTGAHQPLWAPSLLGSDQPKLFLLTRPKNIALGGPRLGFQRTQKILAEHKDNPSALFKALGVDNFVNEASWFELYHGQGAFALDEPPRALPPLPKTAPASQTSETVEKRASELRANLPKLRKGVLADVKLLVATLRPSPRPREAPSASTTPLSEASLHTPEGKLLNSWLSRLQNK